MKGRVDVNFTSSEDRLQKHRALVISKPLISDSGEYTCSIQTFQSQAKKSAKMLIVGKFFQMFFSFHKSL